METFTIQLFLNGITSSVLYWFSWLGTFPQINIRVVNESLRKVKRLQLILEVRYRPTRTLLSNHLYSKAVWHKNAILLSKTSATKAGGKTWISFFLLTGNQHRFHIFGKHITCSNISSNHSVKFLYSPHDVQFSRRIFATGAVSEGSQRSQAVLRPPARILHYHSHRASIAQTTDLHFPRRCQILPTMSARIME